MRKLLLSAFITAVIASVHVHAGVGESAVITLVFPFGSRSSAMGETGTALADDFSALFFNPAGLGIYNEAWQRGAMAYSWEPLLPAFQITDLWHSSFSAYYLLPEEFGGIAIYNNYINMGDNVITDAYGRVLQSVSSYETVFAAGWGFLLSSTPRYTQSIGLTAKVFYSALAPGLGSDGEGTALSFAVDAGYLGIFPFGLRLGVALTNMGPAINYRTWLDNDPIPFTFNIAAGYTRQIVVDNIRAVDFAAELRFDKELVINNSDGHPDPFYTALFADWHNESVDFELQEFNWHVGFETVLLNTLAFRQGYLIDPLGMRFEMHTGFGIHLFNHLRIDYSIINAPEKYMHDFNHRLTGYDEGATGARDGQWQISFGFEALYGWSNADIRWWEVSRKEQR